MKKSLLFVMSMLLVLSTTLAQQRTVSGTVTSEDGETIPGVNVVLKKSSVGTVTDVNGNFSLSVPEEGGTLSFSFIGFQSKDVEIGNRSVIDVAMSSDVKQLSEVVVTGYRSQAKEKSNISAVTINADKIERRPNPSVIQTLQGQVPGLSITTSTGQPGGNSLVNLRGVGSINGQTEPLFIIDGVPVDEDNFRSLNPNEIASINVLRDAGATAIYGNRGANGVIVIETKSGSFNSPLEITYTGQYLTSSLQDNNYDLMNSQEQLLLEREMRTGRGFGMSNAEIDTVATFDWADFFFRNSTGWNHNIQVRKGGENLAAYLSFGYFDQEGILEQSSLTRYNLRANLNGTSNDEKFRYGLNLSMNYSENAEPNAIGDGAINRNYVLGAYQSVPSITPDEYVDGASLVSPLLFVNTPLFLYDRLLTFTRTEDEIKALGALNLSYQIMEGLEISSRTSADFENEELIRTEAPRSFNAILFAQEGNNTPGFAQHQSRQQFTINQLTSIFYNKTFGIKHNFSVGLFTEYFKANLYTMGFFNEGLDPKTFFPGDGSGFVDDNTANDYFVDDVNANLLELGLFSYFGQLDYDYDSKYGLGLTLRRDASSRFSQTNRWGTFYAVSGRWNIHNESFMEGTPFSVLKLRASYGTNGNQDITGTGYFGALDLYRPLFATGGGYAGANSIFLSQIPNTDLRWETIAQSNVGLDFEVFEGRLRGSVDAYVKTTTDLFQSIPVSSINATTAIQGNTGSLENRGIDLQIEYDVIRSASPQGLNLTLTFVGNHNKQELLELAGGEDEQIGLGRVGGQLFEYYDYEYAGVNPANGNMLFYTAAGEVTEDPNIDTDRVWTGLNIYPEYQGSFGFDLDFKGFFFTTQFNYFVGLDRYDFDLSGFSDPTDVGQFRSTRDLLRAWTPANPVTNVPSLRASNIDLDGTRFLRVSDYTRLRFASIGYNFPQELVDKVGLTFGRIFVNGENLFTLTQWRGFDAEALSNTSRIYPTPRTYTVGVEFGF